MTLGNDYFVPNMVIWLIGSHIGPQQISRHHAEPRCKTCALAGGKAAQIGWPSCARNPLESWCRNQDHDRVPRQGATGF